MRRKTSAPSFIDALLPPDLGQDDMLDRIDSVVDWSRVAQLLDGVHDSPEGRPAYSPITMIKVILLQQWNNLSDMDAEKMLRGAHPDLHWPA